MRGLRTSLVLCGLILACLLCGAVPASAAIVTDRPLLFSFDGADTSGGQFTDVWGVEVDQATGDVYVASRALPASNAYIHKFNASGEAQPFSATGDSSLEVTADSENKDIAVDNSGVNPGRIYVTQDQSGPVLAFDSAGHLLWKLEPQSSTFFPFCAAAVDDDGHLFLSARAAPQRVYEFASSGAPPAQLDFFGYVNGGFFPCSLEFDGAGNAYVASENGVFKYVAGAFSAVLDPEGSQGVAADRSSANGHIFVSHSEDFKEYDSAGALVGTFGKGVLSAVRKIAYNEALDRVYVGSFEGVVYAFGPEATSVVPDVSAEAATEVAISKAKLHGTVNPQSVPNSYFFEWKAVASAEGWGSAKSSAPQSLAEDGSDHAVSLDVSGLKSGTAYQARLVALNTESGLRSVSAPVTFTTQLPPTAPTVTLDPASSVTENSAEITAAINPQEDFGTTWRVSISTDPVCASGFDERPLRSLESEAASPVAVSEELTGLLPNQHYCVRIVASNGAGSTNSNIVEFTTDATPPDQVFTAPAAPRTDTTARLNAYVNPQGSPTTFRFEYSADGGKSWSTLPEGDAGAGRKSIPVSTELTGLSPGTAYLYRFSTENQAGSTPAEGTEKTLTTRTTAEMQTPSRGVELVNQPDKGNQNPVVWQLPQGTPPFTESGEEILWFVRAGAPGAPTGTGGIFLSNRTASGWHSRSLLPPADQLAGGGEIAYTAIAATPDFSRFLTMLGSFTAGPPAAAIYRFDSSQHSELLAQYAPSDGANKFFHGQSVDSTTDLAHVVLVDRATFLLVDVGSGSEEVVGLLPNGSPPPCGVDPENASDRFFRGEYHWISTTDASRVYFVARPGAICDAPLSLFVRNRDAGTTIEIAAGGDPRFVRATPDGRDALFTSASQLTPADSNSGRDIYRWSEGSGLSCVTCLVSAAGVAHSGTHWIVVSDDLSHIYFTSRGMLIPGRGNPGDENLYLIEEGTIRFIGEAGKAGTSNELGNTRLSDDGEVLLFTSTDRPTSDPIADKCGELPCNELYRYDDADGSLECVSCLRGGTTDEPVGSGGTNDIDFDLSADGDTVAFTTREALLPGDVNNVLDVYEWHNGALRLVTDGVTEFNGGNAAPALVGVSGSARDIFFTVSQPGLTGFERDNLVNLYDARVGGGFNRPTPPDHCVEDSCQGPLLPPPVMRSPASTTFEGGQNASERRKKARCGRKRGKARRACLRRHRKRQGRKATAALRNQGRTK
jgi:hypothetical protein